MATSVNQQLADETIGHLVDLQRYGNGVVRRMIGVLNRADPDIRAQLTDAMSRLDPSSFTVQRLEQLLYSVNAINTAAYSQVEQDLTREMHGLTDFEAGREFALLQRAIPSEVLATVGIDEVNVEQTYAAAMSRPFQGRLLSEWADKLEMDRMWRIRNAVRMGYVEQQTIDQITRNVMGTASTGFGDGAIALDRTSLESVVRTAIGHFAGFTRNSLFAANSDVVDRVQWVSTLDTRTTIDCIVRDGCLYTADDHEPIDHSYPWGGGPGALHWNCRSVSAPVIKGWSMLGLDSSKLTAGTRASMDGQVPEDLKYADWLRRQSAARQDEVLGPTRGALFRRGGLDDVNTFVNRKGDMLSLDDLRRRDPGAFAEANVD